MLLFKRSNHLGFISGFRSIHGLINFERFNLCEGYLYEGAAKKYFVLKGNHLYAFKQKHTYRQANASEIIDLEIYDNCKQTSYTNNKFELLSSTLENKRTFQTGTKTEMSSWLRNIQCIQQNIKKPQIHFIDANNKTSPYVNH
eukprot:232476_1